jgi:hypothetical protein
MIDSTSAIKEAEFLETNAYFRCSLHISKIKFMRLKSQ